MKLLTTSQNPSPNHEISYAEYAHTSRKSRKCLFTREHFHKRSFIEKTLPGTAKGKRLQAGMTVEASILLPLFLFFFLYLISGIEMLRLHGNMEMALWETGNHLSVVGSALQTGSVLSNQDGENRELWKELADVALSYTYVKKNLLDYRGVNYYENSPLSYGAMSLQFLGSDIISNKDYIDLVVSYPVAASKGNQYIFGFWMENRYYGHMWTGFELPKNAEETSAVYYMTETGTVYHLSKECTHLLLTIHETAIPLVFTQKNKSGHYYRECVLCKGTPYLGRIWITDTGECYHLKKDCSGLKRTIRTVTEKEIENVPLCKRCEKNQP